MSMTTLGEFTVLEIASAIVTTVVKGTNAAGRAVGLGGGFAEGPVRVLAEAVGVPTAGLDGRREEGGEGDLRGGHGERRIYPKILR